MYWNKVKKGQNLPFTEPRLCLCHCPEWCAEGYQVAMFDGRTFSYEFQPNDGFSWTVKKWAYME